MRNISEYIMLKGVQWQVVGRCNYDNTPGDWAAYKALTYNEQYKGEEVLLLRSCGYPPLSNKNIISFKEYIDQVKSLKVSKGYRRATYKDIEDGKKVCLRDDGSGKPSYEYDYNCVGGPITNKESDAKYINISSSPSNTRWVRLHDLCIKR